METILTNLAAAKTRRVKRGDRDYLVAPMTLIVPGVLNGSKGALYYPPEEIARNVSEWNHQPLVVYHPQKDGVNVSAKSIPSTEYIGFLDKVRVNNKGALVGEGWFDEQATKRVDHRVYNALVNHTQIELSTGLYTTNVPAPAGSVYNGRAYSHIATKYVPDHLAILPDMNGACSLNDGCGVLVNKAADEGTILRELPKDLAPGDWWRRELAFNSSNEYVFRVFRAPEEEQSVVNDFSPEARRKAAEARRQRAVTKMAAWRKARATVSKAVGAQRAKQAHGQSKAADAASKKSAGSGDSASHKTAAREHRAAAILHRAAAGRSSGEQAQAHKEAAERHAKTAQEHVKASSDIKMKGKDPTANHFVTNEYWNWIDNEPTVNFWSAAARAASAKARSLAKRGAKAAYGKAKDLAKRGASAALRHVAKKAVKLADKIGGKKPNTMPAMRKVPVAAKRVKPPTAAQKRDKSAQNKGFKNHRDLQKFNAASKRTVATAKKRAAAETRANKAKKLRQVKSNLNKKGVPTKQVNSILRGSGVVKPRKKKPTGNRLMRLSTALEVLASNLGLSQDVVDNAWSAAARAKAAAARKRKAAFANTASGAARDAFKTLRAGGGKRAALQARKASHKATIAHEQASKAARKAGDTKAAVRHLNLANKHKNATAKIASKINTGKFDKAPKTGKTAKGTQTNKLSELRKHVGSKVTVQMKNGRAVQGKIHAVDRFTKSITVKKSDGNHLTYFSHEMKHAMVHNDDHEPIDNELSHEGIRDEIMSSLRSQFSQRDPSAWVTQVYDDYFIYEQAGSLWKMEYAVTGDDEVVLSADSPVKVEREVSYVPCEDEESDMAGNQRRAVIDQIIANCDCWEESDRATLMAMDDGKLAKIHASGMKERENAVLANAARAGFEDQRGDNHVFNAKTQQWEKRPKEAPKPEVTDNSSRLTPEEQADLAYARQMRTKDRDSKIGAILGNSANKFKKEELEKLSPDMLDGLHSTLSANASQQPMRFPDGSFVMGQQPEQQLGANYFGATGGPPTGNTQTKEGEEDLLIPPTTNWAEVNQQHLAMNQNKRAS